MSVGKDDQHLCPFSTLTSHNLRARAAAACTSYSLQFQATYVSAFPLDVALLPNLVLLLITPTQSPTQITLLDARSDERQAKAADMLMLEDCKNTGLI